MVTSHKAFSEGAKNHAAKEIWDLCIVLAMYLTLSYQLGSGVSGLTLPTYYRDSEASQLTQCQTLLLRGIVEGRTNHELATELGF